MARSGGGTGPKASAATRPRCQSESSVEHRIPNHTGYAGRHALLEEFSKLSGILETELPESNVEVTEAVYLGCGIVPGHAVQTRKLRASPSGLLSYPLSAAAPLPATSPLRLRLNEVTLSSRSRRAAACNGEQ